MKELKLTFSFDGFRGGNVFICSPALRRQVSLPKGIKEIFAVFSKTDRYPQDAYTLTAPKYKLDHRGGVGEFNGILGYNTRTFLAKNYQRGYRFVHFEY